MKTLLLLGTTPGCFLVGYDGVPSAPSLDASGDGDGDRESTLGDASSAWPDDASGEELIDASLDAASSSDAATSANDAGAPISRDAASDASDASDANASCLNPNACGGCAPLPQELGEACGVCGLGEIVCDGEEAVTCNGGDAYPSASGGAILIDDFEDGDRFVDGAGSLSGDWHTVSDSSGGTLMPSSGTPLVPSAGGPTGSVYAMKLSGSGFKTWGAGLAVSLNALACRYDASMQKGIRFSAKGSGTLLVSAATRQTTPPGAGGTCLGTACNDHFNKTYPLSSTWTPFVVPFTSLQQTGWGTVATFSASQLLYLQFSFGPNSTFELQVDNVSFY